MHSKSDAIRVDVCQNCTSMEDHLVRLNIEGTLYTSHVCSTCKNMSQSTDSDQGSGVQIISLIGHIHSLCCIQGQLINHP